MRLLAYTLTLGLLAVAGWLGYGLYQKLQQPHVSPTLAATLASSPTGEATPPAPPRRWPLLFGERAAPVPQPPEEKQPPQPPQPPLPPLENLGYSLKGIVRNNGADWAIVTHPTGDQILRAGDHLTPDFQVDEIAEEGLWLLARGERVLLRFDTEFGQ